MDADPTTTRLLADARRGDRAALDALLPRVYEELRLLAHARLRRHRPGETLNTTAVVHEAYLKLTAGESPGWESRAHFFALAARAMRFVLIGYARARARHKRGGPGEDLPLDEGLAVAAADGVEEEALELLSLDAALDSLAARDHRLAETVEMRFFAGMAHEEIAAATGRSVPTVKRDWRRARTYLYRFMGEGRDRDPAPRDPAKEG